MPYGFYYWIWLQMFYHLHNALADNSPYSLQSAVDVLNHQEYPLNSYSSATLQRPRYYYNGDVSDSGGVGGGNGGSGGVATLGNGFLPIPSMDQNYWENENVGGNFLVSPKNSQRNRLNKQLRKFLEREYFMNNVNSNNNNNDENNNGLSFIPFDGYEFDEYGNNNNNNNKLLPTDFYADERKRASSYFRERDNAYDDLPVQLSSIFRERDLPQVNNNNNELSDQFLHEIENERKNRYRGDVYENFLDKYHPQSDNNDDMIIDNFHQFHIDRDKRMRVPPYYLLMQKKRSYPILPWLPYTAEHNAKHVGIGSMIGAGAAGASTSAKAAGGGNGNGDDNFPVSKRSAGTSTNRLDVTDSDVMKWKNDNHNNNDKNYKNDTNDKNGKKALMKTDENVEKELIELFNDHNDNKNNLKEEKKRSIDEQMYNDVMATTAKPITTTTSAANNHQQDNNDSDNDGMNVKDAARLPSDAIKLTDMHLGMHQGHNHAHNHGHNSQHDNEHNHDYHNQHHDSGMVHKHNQEHNKHDEAYPTNVNNKPDDVLMAHKNNDAEINNNIEYDRHDMHGGHGYNNYADADDDSRILGMRQKKSIDWSKYFGLDRKKKSINDYNNNNNNNNNNNYINQLLDPIKLENVGMKLQAMEDYIINDTIKYTGAHQGIENPQEIRMVKNRILSRLATAYNLEKMRRTLDKLRQAAENDKHLLHNMIEADENDVNQPHVNELLELMKNDKFDSGATLSANNDDNNDDGDDDIEHNRELKTATIMKKNNDLLRHYPAQSNDLDDFKLDDYLNVRSKLLNMAYADNKDHLRRNEQCPILETVINHCRSVDLLSGDLNQDLLQHCVIHQICYLCGTSRLACDYQYLEEADKECGYLNNECQSTARSALMILRGSSALQFSSRQCSKNSCLYNIIRDIDIGI